MDFLTDTKKWQWSLVVAFFGVCLLLIGVLVDRHQANDVAAKAQEVSAVIQTAMNRVSDAIELVANRRGDYPSKYSQFDTSLDQARQVLGDHGQADTFLADLAKAQQERDWTRAYEILEQLSIIVAQDVGVVDRILGPPNTEGQGYYDDLDRQSRAVDAGLVNQVQAWIAEVDQYVDLLPRKYLCNSTFTLTYSDAYTILDAAQSQLDQANVTSMTQVEGMIDKPLVYQEASNAQASADQAKAEADGDNSGADLAPGQIANAEYEVAAADGYVATHWYRLAEAQSALGNARSEVQASYIACYAADFAGVTAHVSSAISWADNAEWLATEPTPTPEPPPTPEPSTSSGSSSWDSGSSDSGSWSSGGSDSGSWDFSSSDSGSWDSGGGYDGGGWDSGGGDDGDGW